MIDDATPDAETTYFGHVEHESSQAVFFKGFPNSPNSVIFYRTTIFEMPNSTQNLN